MREPDPKQTYFCKSFEQRHWQSLFQKIFQKFLKWTALENRHYLLPLEKRAVKCNKYLPQEQRLADLAAGPDKRLGLVVPQLWHKPTVCRVSTWACLCISSYWIWSGEGNQYEHEPRLPMVLWVTKSFVSGPKVSRLLPAPRKLWPTNLLVCQKGKSQKCLGL